MEALQEITDLPMKRIEKIAGEVKAKYNKLVENTTYPDYSEPSLAKRVIKIAVIGCAVLAVLYIVISIASNVIQYNKRAKAKKDYQELTQKYKELVDASRIGNLQMTEYLIEQGIPAEVEGYEYDSALMAAARGGHIEVIELLLKSSADVTKKNKEGFTALDIAEEGPNISVRRTLARAMAEVSPADSPLRTLLKKNLSFSQKTFLESVEKNNLETIGLFLAADADKFANDWDESGIKEAARLGRTEALKLILEKGKDIKSVTKNTALLFAAREGRIGAIDVLLDNGADINFRIEGSASSPERGFTPLMRALSENSGAAEHLLERGADPNFMGGYPEMPPIMVPIYHGFHFRVTDVQIKQVRLLIKYGADVNKKDKDGTTPLEYARSLRRAEGRPIAIILKEAGAAVPFTEDSFMELVFENDPKNIKLFLEKGFDPNIKGFEYNDKDTTALIKSAMLGYRDMARVLIEHGADVNFRTSLYKKTALLMAVKNEDVEMVRLLLDSGAKVTEDVMNVVNDFYVNYPKHDAIRALIKRARL